MVFYELIQFVVLDSELENSLIFGFNKVIVFCCVVSCWLSKKTEKYTHKKNVFNHKLFYIKIWHNFTLFKSITQNTAQFGCFYLVFIF